MVDAIWNVPDSKGYNFTSTSLDMGDVSIGRVRYVGGWGHTGTNTARSVVLPGLRIGTTQFELENQDASQSCYLTTGRAAENWGGLGPELKPDVRATDWVGTLGGTRFSILSSSALGSCLWKEAGSLSGFWKVWLRQDRGHYQHSERVQTFS